MLALAAVNVCMYYTAHLSAKDCAGIILYCAEKATQVALDTIQVEKPSNISNLTYFMTC